MELSSRIKWKNRETLSGAAFTALARCSFKSLLGWIEEGAPCSATGTGGSKVYRINVGAFANWFRRRELNKSLAARKQGKRYKGRRICHCCGRLKKLTEMHADEVYICVTCDVMLRKHYAEIGIMDEAA